jgi:hypothetical protein
MKWEERQCVFNGQVNTAPCLTWIWAEYIIGLENGNYLLSSEDGEDEMESSDWSIEVAAEDVVQIFLRGPYGTSGWYNFYESETEDYSLESLISLVEGIADVARVAGDDRLVDAVNSSKELAELKQELQEWQDEQ